jgi:transposase
VKRFIGGEESKRQRMLLPQSIDEYVERDCLARFIDEIVENMDLSRLVEQYPGGGAPAYHPASMVKILILAYSLGIRHSRAIANLAKYDLRFRFLAEGETPDFRTICRFRQKHAEAFQEIFLQTVELARYMGLVLLQHVALDGTKLEANVSGLATYSRERLEKDLGKTRGEIAKIMEEAERADQQDDEQYGDSGPDQLPEALRDQQSRLRLLEQAKRAMEESGRNTVAATDLESRVMKTTAGNRAAYNAQAVVDEAHQIIVAAAVTQEENDAKQFPVMLQRTAENLGALPEKVSADAGYGNQNTLQYVETAGLDAYIAVGGRRECKANLEYDAERDEYRCAGGQALKFHKVRQHGGRTYRIYRCYRCSGCALAKECHGESSRYKELWVYGDGGLRSKMAAKLKSAEGKKVYNQRSAIVEPVFGHLKTAFGLRRLLLRGLSGATIEYLLCCIAHNLGKLKQFWPPGRAEMAAA